MRLSRARPVGRQKFCGALQQADNGRREHIGIRLGIAFVGAPLDELPGEGLEIVFVRGCDVPRC